MVWRSGERRACKGIGRAQNSGSSFSGRVSGLPGLVHCVLTRDGASTWLVRIREDSLPESMLEPVRRSHCPVRLLFLSFVL